MLVSEAAARAVLTAPNLLTCLMPNVNRPQDGLGRANMPDWCLHVLKFVELEAEDLKYVVKKAQILWHDTHKVEHKAKLVCWTYYCMSESSVPHSGTPILAV